MSPVKELGDLELFGSDGRSAMTRKLPSRSTFCAQTTPASGQPTPPPLCRFVKEMKAFRRAHFQTQISDFHRLTGIAKIDIHY
jgi:hypothetical protein